MHRLLTGRLRKNSAKPVGLVICGGALNIARAKARVPLGSEHVESTLITEPTSPFHFWRPGLRDFSGPSGEAFVCEGPRERAKESPVTAVHPRLSLTRPGQGWVKPLCVYVCVSQCPLLQPQVVYFR